jgi:dephospho-CoA kinase
MIIGLCGKKRSGKNEIAKYLSNKLNIPIYSFADPLKDLVFEVSGLTDSDKENDELYEGKNFNIFPIKKELKKYKYDKLTEHEIDSLKAIEYFKISEIYRHLLQYIGTNIFRNRNEYHWINLFKNKFTYNDIYNGSFIISDIRFINEYMFINSLPESKCIKITRNFNNFNDNHISENEIDKIRFTYKFKNNYNTLYDMYIALDKYFGI